MKLYDGGLIIMIGILLVCVIAGTLSINYLGPDNAIEEAVEEVIVLETGNKIDLSPGEENATGQR